MTKKKRTFTSAEKKAALEARISAGYGDHEIDRREFNGHTIVLQEDRHKGMMKNDDSGSMQYIISVEGKNGQLDHKRYITDIAAKIGLVNAKYGAKLIFANPERYKNVMGEYWIGYNPPKS